jgi:cyclophilin family peptidyl-prolyl cis-trans isomerase
MVLNSTAYGGNGEEVILEFEIRNFFKPGPIKYYNVIGTIPGTKYPNEYVVISGHLDSFDIATGAIDNGSGVSTMMEAIRLIVQSDAKPKRSIMIHLYAAEEQGLVGSKSWVNKNKKLLDKISLVINKDSGTNPAVSMGVPKVMFDDIKKAAEPLESAGLKYPFKITESQPYRKAGRGGTDSYSFLMEGVPAPGLRLEGPHQYGRTWHTPLDTYNEVIPDAQQHSSIVIAVLAYGVANLDHLLNREGAFVPDGIYADLNTNKGRISLKLDFENVPMTVANFVGLAEGKIKNDAIAEGRPYFNGSKWHRVVPGHVIQAGMPNTGNETEGPGYAFPNEIYKGLSHNKAGMLGMANAGANTNGSQFYITLGDRSYLDGNYSLFGTVTDGMEVVNKIVQGDTIKTVTISRIGQKAIDFKVTNESFLKMVEEAKAKIIANDEEKTKKENDLIKKKFPKAKESGSGLKYIINKQGSGEKLAEGTIVKVLYKGSFLMSSEKFVSTNENGRPNSFDKPEVFEFTIGKTKINPALDESIADMKPGEVRTVIAVSKLAYGNNVVYGKTIEGKKRFGIPANTSLVYEIEVMK